MAEIIMTMVITIIGFAMGWLFASQRYASPKPPKYLNKIS